MPRSIAVTGRAIIAVLGLWLVQPTQQALACEDVWFTATAEQDGRTIIFRSRKGPPCGVAIHEFPVHVSVLWPYKPANDGGMPDAATNAGQIDLEDALIALDHAGHSHLMLVITGNGAKEWIWYARDFDDWIGRLNGALRAHPAYPIDIEYQSDPEWSLYRDFINWMPGTERLP